MKLPIVDENDNQIGVKERDQLLKDDIYRVSALWATNSKGEVLIAQRALSKKKNPGKWGPAVAGTVEENETYETNIIKEIQEEIGISIPIENLRKGPKTKRVSPIDTYFTQWYFTNIDKKLDELIFPENEVMALKWISVADLRQSLSDSPEDFIPSAPDWIEAVLAES